MPWPFTSPSFVWSANADGLAIRFASAKRFAQAKSGRGSEAECVGYQRMLALAECGEASVSEVNSGIFIACDDAVRLDVETRQGFDLPHPWPGGMRLQTGSDPQLADFSASLAIVDPGASPSFGWQLRGPILELGQRSYLPSAAQFAALKAFVEWQVSGMDEIANLSLIVSLREAHLAGCMIDLEAYGDDGAIIVRADELVIDAREDRATGDVVLCPLPQGSFGELKVDAVEKRLHHLDGERRRAVVRVGKTIILLTETQTAQARAIKARSRVPRAERQAYERDPQQWLADHVFPDVEAEFSPRVTGIGEWRGGYVGGALGEPEDWFGKQPEAGKPANEPGETVPDDGPSTNDTPKEITPPPIMPLIIPNDDTLAFGWPFTALDENAATAFHLDFTRYARQPMPHQEEAIRWMLAHSRRALHAQSVGRDSKGYGAGALLADDMGLGKTYSTLILLAEWLRHWRESTGSEPPAVLIVAPLSLLENWKVEIGKTFHAEATPFRRVVIAQGDADLDNFRRSPGARDKAVPGNVLTYGLDFGHGTEHSLDWPGSCVLTTYQTLRDYRFSFAKCEWSAAVFDEAQNVKNPNAQQTIAAKALKALFRIALTGTPVENHLGDFWSIIDTAEPGPLGAFAAFRQRWIAPMNREPHRKTELGKALQEHVGGLMLRRTKEGSGIALPGKKQKPQECPMTSEQQAVYESARDAVNQASKNAGDGSDNQGHHLAALWHLRQVSLHPDLVGGGSIPSARSEKESRKILERSGKLVWMLSQLEEIRQAGEKVLIFCVLKQLQQSLAHHLQIIFGVPVPIINGDTKTTSTRGNEATRLGLIDEFSIRPGFAICVLSPIAAGAGLNIVAANHVIHLERHWNPAKEDQATDRAYRIGATKPVTVYLPAATHPDFPAFDVILGKLLAQKRGLQSALGLIPPESVSGTELFEEIFGARAEPHQPVERALTLDQALKLSWKLFEALIGVIYKREAERVILTPHGADHGCDVVVLGWGERRENLLIQCKTSAGGKLDSEEGVRAVEGSRPFFEKPLGVTFHQRILVTTAASFSGRTLRASRICGVELQGRAWLANALERQRVTMTEVLGREGQRARV